MAKFEKLVDYRIEFLGGFYSNARGEEIIINRTLSKTELAKVKRAIGLGIIKEIGGDSISNGNAELEEANAEIVKLKAELEEAKGSGLNKEVISDIHSLSKNELKAKYSLEN